MWFIPLILAAIQGAAGYDQAQDQNKYNAQQQKLANDASHREALARAIKAKTTLRNPDPLAPFDPSETQTIQGVAQAGQAVNWGNMGGAAADSMGGLSAGVYSAD
jgi:hypothetical protein